MTAILFVVMKYYVAVHSTILYNNVMGFVRTKINVSSRLSAYILPLAPSSRSAAACLEELARSQWATNRETRNRACTDQIGWWQKSMATAHSKQRVLGGGNDMSWTPRLLKMHSAASGPACETPTNIFRYFSVLQKSLLGSLFVHHRTGLTFRHLL